MRWRDIPGLLPVQGWERGMEEEMDQDQLAEVIRRRLNLDDEEWTIVKENPKFQRLFKNAAEASKSRFVPAVMTAVPLAVAGAASSLKKNGGEKMSTFASQLSHIR